MKTRRPARRGRRARLWGRIAGYGGTLLLVAAAVIVLLMPLADDGKKGTAGAQGQASPSASGLPGPPGGGALPATPTNPVPQQNGGGQPYPSGGSGGQGGGPQIPQPTGGGSTDWCPNGTAFYRATVTGVDVLVTVSASGLIRTELVLQGQGPKSQQASVKGGRPHTFHFTGVSPRLVERVRVTTVSVGGGMQSCYARGV
ncbi:hypothetical protein [Actinomadura latina]|uniref:Uncharacterized protein n=1 Tax=Actinomadura latina TaxID=163603 RepID=A0A846YUT1_9ACTN|nr:hypothetical protein [Actinomadura latina]NKZ04169.1 hypothetical protein [Actinomadura latina]